MKWNSFELFTDEQSAPVALDHCWGARTIPDQLQSIVHGWDCEYCPNVIWSHSSPGIVNVELTKAVTFYISPDWTKQNTTNSYSSGWHLDLG